MLSKDKLIKKEVKKNLLDPQTRFRNKYVLYICSRFSKLKMQFLKITKSNFIKLQSTRLTKMIVTTNELNNNILKPQNIIQKSFYLKFYEV